MYGSSEHQVLHKKNKTILYLFTDIIKTNEFCSRLVVTQWWIELLEATNKMKISFPKVEPLLTPATPDDTDDGRRAPGSKGDPNEVHGDPAGSSDGGSSPVRSSSGNIFLSVVMLVSPV